MSSSFGGKRDRNAGRQQRIGTVHDSNDTPSGRAAMQLSTCLSMWLDDRIRPSHALSTLERYGSIANRIVSELGDVSITAIRPIDVATLYRRLLAGNESHRPVKTNTLISYHAVLHQSLEYASDLDLIEHNPTIPPPRPGTRVQTLALSAAEIERLISACEDVQTRVLIALLVRTGMRRGEYQGLVWSNVDLLGRQILIRKSLQRFSGLGYQLVEPKTTSSRRTLAISEEMASLLVQHRAYQQHVAALRQIPWTDAWLVFGGPDGAAVSWYQHWQAFDRARRIAGFPTLRVHDLRHTAASLMMQAGVHPKVMSERLGHSKIEVTLNIYSHVLPEMQSHAARAVEELFAKT